MICVQTYLKPRTLKLLVGERGISILNEEDFKDIKYPMLAHFGFGIMGIRDMKREQQIKEGIKAFKKDYGNCSIELVYGDGNDF